MLAAFNSTWRSLQYPITTLQRLHRRPRIQVSQVINDVATVPYTGPTLTIQIQQDPKQILSMIKSYPKTQIGSSVQSLNYMFHGISNHIDAPYLILATNMKMEIEDLFSWMVEGQSEDTE